MSSRACRTLLLALSVWWWIAPALGQEELPAPKPLTQGVTGEKAKSDCPDCVPSDASPNPWPDIEPPAVVLRVLAPAQAQGDVNYQVCLENRSQSAAYGVLLRGQLPEGARLVRSDPSPKQTGKELLWEIGTLSGGAKQCLRLTLAAGSAGDLQMCFRVAYEHGVCLTTRIRAKPALNPDETPTAAARLELTLTGPGTASLATPIPYRLTISNKGTAPAQNVRLVSRLPAAAAFVSASDGGQFNLEARQTVWNLDQLGAGQSRTVELKLRAEQPGTLIHEAEATAAGGLTARAQVRTEVSGAPGLHLELVDTADPLLLKPDLAVANQESTVYRITVRNTGAGPASNLRLTAIAPPELVIIRVEGPFAHTHQEGDAYVYFNPFILPAGEQVQFRIECKPRRAGYVKFRVELSGDPLPSGPVREEESTNIVTDLKDQDEVFRRDIRLKWHLAEPRVAEGPQ